MKKNFLYYVKICAPLLLICACVAGLLALVNMVTREPIAEYNAAKREAAFVEFFPETATSATVDTENSSVNAVYELYDGENNLIGYCVDVSSAGYGGKINLMVGISLDGSVAGVSVISHTETKGLTSTETSAPFFAGFVGKSGTLTVGESIDAMSGATISSKAVTAAVNIAISLGLGEVK